MIFWLGVAIGLIYSTPALPDVGRIPLTLLPPRPLDEEKEDKRGECEIIIKDETRDHEAEPPRRRFSGHWERNPEGLKFVEDQVWYE